jgi:hypothetical protein
MVSIIITLTFLYIPVVWSSRPNLNRQREAAATAAATQAELPRAFLRLARRNCKHHPRRRQRSLLRHNATTAATPRLGEVLLLRQGLVRGLDLDRGSSRTERRSSLGNTSLEDGMKGLDILPTPARTNNKTDSSSPSPRMLLNPLSPQHSEKTAAVMGGIASFSNMKTLETLLKRLENGFRVVSIKI